MVPVQRMDAGTREKVVLQLQRHVGNVLAQAVLANATAVRGGRPAAVAQRIDAARGRGSAMEPTSRARLESSYGVDFSGVRVHTGEEADALTRSVNAQAFTSGHDIFVSRSADALSSRGGFALLAHETAHVVQQSTGSVPGRDVGGGLQVSEPGDAGERSAESMADQAVRRPAVPVQRLKALGAPVPQLVLQRLTDPLGDDLEVDWTTPNAKVDLTDQVGTPVAGSGPLNFQGGDSATFTVPDRKATASVTFPVTASWHPKAQPPGPNPAPAPTPTEECNACKVLEDEAKANACVFIFDVVREASNIAVAAAVLGPCLLATFAFGPKIPIIPEPILKLCKTANIDDVIDQLRKLKKSLGNDSGVTQVIIEILKFVKDSRIPGLSDLSGIPLAIRTVMSKRLDSVIEKLEELRDKCKKGGGTKPVTATKGNATSTMKTTVFINPDGTVRAVGPGPAQNVSGSGATEESPVRFSQDAIPNGAQIAQVPTIVVSGQDGPKAGRQFTVNVQYGLPPQPVAINCVPGEFFPFAVAKDRFENELEGQKSIRDWYFGHDPEIRNTAEKGDATIKVTGRASNTGKVEFNRILAEKRGARVRDLISDFAGSDSHLRVFSTGFLTAKEPGESGHERRADAQIIGQVPADRAGLMTGGDPCSGHNNESSEQGVTGPQTSPLPGLEGVGSEAP